MLITELAKLRTEIARVVAREAGWGTPTTDHYEAATQILGLVETAQKPKPVERNSNVHPLFRDTLNAFADSHDAEPAA